MNYNVKATPEFLSLAKRLSKKYPSLKADLQEFTKNLASNPEQGISLGKNCFKIRLSIISKGKGKSGGARVITCVFKIEESVYLMSIYDKAEKKSVSAAELKQLIKEVTAARNDEKKNVNRK